MKKLNRKQAQDILLNAKVAIHQLEKLEADYEIWQNAKISHQTLKQIKKKLDLIYREHIRNTVVNRIDELLNLN